MSRVAVVLRIFPEDVATNLEDIVNEIKQKLPPEYSLELWDTEPIAFGLNALRVLIVMPENVEGGTEHLEELISQIPGVSQVETIVVHRVF
ncbi:MAG: elongation factor 1-beta [Desulfurococcaceae archaeon]